MIDEFSGTVQIATTPEATWAVIQDPAALGRALPDCESIVPDGSGGLKIVVAIKQMFMTVRVDLHVTYHDLEQPHHLRLDLDGAPRGLGGALHLSVPIEITATDRIDVDYKGRSSWRACSPRSASRSARGSRPSSIGSSGTSSAKPGRLGA